jgi:hypothetical protein
LATNRKRISFREKEFAHLIVNGNTATDAARKAFGWKCEPYSKETQKAYNLGKTKRVRDEIDRLRAHKAKEAQGERIVLTSDSINIDELRKFAYERLEESRDNEATKAPTRFLAIKALEELSDPATDINLIWRWIDTIWRGGKAHCPKCHTSFPLWKIKNPKLDDYRIEFEVGDHNPIEGDDYARRMELIKLADRRQKPHKSQIPALKAPERHVVGMAAARAGKSFLLGLFAFMGFLIPGVEIWVLSRAYAESRSEVEFLRGFLKTAFYPLDKHMIKEQIDKKTGEITLTSRWGSELKIKSSKSQGSITGRELEMCLIAEPAWVPEDLYEEVRARMSSRFGRILALGTPKGYGGFLARMTNLKGRDPETGKILRLKNEDRLIANGAKWSQSIFVYRLEPTDNPSYPKSELEAARMELTDAEYDSEFLGIMSAEEGAKFPMVKEHMIRRITREEYQKCSFVQGVDQGAKNFGAVLAGWDGQNIYISREYFNGREGTIKANLMKLRKTAPMLIDHMGGDKSNWKFTVFDADPNIDNILTEMEEEGNEWPTSMTFRPKNKATFQEDWREETTIWINEMANKGRIWFDEDCSDLLWQVLDCLNKPRVEGRDGKSPSDKGWFVRDKWRSDHVLDAFMLAVWSVATGQIELPPEQHEIKRGWDDQRAAFDYQIAVNEARDLSGMVDSKADEQDIFKKHFGRPRPGGRIFNPPNSWYKDA